MSDCYVRGTDLLYHYITLLFNCMLVQGVVPEDFRVSILVPIPKGPRVDARNSDNYRAVALSSVLGKILENIIACIRKRRAWPLQINNLNTRLTFSQLCVAL